VFILAKFIKFTWPTKKLSEKYLGLFIVVGKPNTYLYLIKLLNHLCTIYPVFHVSQIKPAPLSNIPNWVNPPPLPLEIDTNLEFKVAQILDSKLNRCKKRPWLYLIQWSGYKGTLDKYLWTPMANLENATNLVSDYHSLYPKKPGPLTQLWSPPPKTTEW